MSWTRFDDGWCEEPIILDLGLDARWHYISMIQYCSRTKRFDGVMRSTEALRCSDVPEPESALAQLVDVGLVVLADSGHYVIPNMEEGHAPPVWVRNKAEASKMSKRRSRSHDAGDHALCAPGECEGGASKGASKGASGRGSAQKRAGGASASTSRMHDSRTGQDRPVQEAQAFEHALEEKELGGQGLAIGDLAVDPDAWPEDDFGLHWRNEAEEADVVTVQGLMDARAEISTEEQAKKCMAAAFPGRRF